MIVYTEYIVSYLSVLYHFSCLKDFEKVLFNIHIYYKEEKKSNICDCLNPLPNDNFLDWTRVKEFAEHKLNVIENQFFSEKGRKQCWKRIFRDINPK